MQLQYGAYVNIVTLVIYFIYLCIAVYLSIRQGLGHNFPWICMVVLSLCRLTQVALDLAATAMFPPATTPNTSLQSGVAILTSISLTPLFMSTSSVLNMTSNPKGRRMQWVLILLHVPLVISLILIVAGGIDPDSREGPTFAATEPTKAGIAIYCACFVVLIWATTTIAARLYLATSMEVKILTTVVLSLPFFLVDVVYMMCFAFDSLSGSQRFNVISGNVTLQLCMQVIMEYIIVGLYLGLGLELPDKAARLRDELMGDQDFERIRETMLWKMYEAMSVLVAVTVMPAIMFAHWLLGKILRSGATI
ncbi:hypothetical protein K458DRAFT_363311 [Lentithecium fluviatile CBS 122367]|uniref:DUF7702 domain-containing protein n=1 Tax=Lentithecium fluviatile CBS 122367 TaxID=1168545 RepID=A0A6G1J9L6_9PLEO|nr:hypothetical protein K458DRAFT_363311 [Lentithecium fluviatile CBS 122367]